MSARTFAQQCMPNVGIAAAFGQANLALAAAGLPEYHHILLGNFCKEDNTLQANGDVHRWVEAKNLCTKRMCSAV